jgi:hypothetical protein
VHFPAAGFSWPQRNRAAEKISVRGIKDFGKINDYLYRKSTPNPWV